MIVKKQKAGVSKRPAIGPVEKIVEAAKIVVANDLFPGEKHGFLQLPNGQMERAAYLGPGTQVVTRLQQNIPGKTPVDSAAKQHDIDYSLATAASEVVLADRKFLSRVKNIQKSKLDNAFNIQQAYLIKPKVFIEKLLGANKLKFSDLKGASGDEHQLLLNNRKTVLYGI
jgi:hypothetical protein